VTSDEYDPVYLNARREAVTAIGLFTLALAWSVGTFYFTGYVKPPELPDNADGVHRELTLGDDPRFNAPPVSTTFGMPTWVFTGILLPWLVIDCVAFWFCYWYMADDDLEPPDATKEASSGEGEAPAEPNGESSRPV